MTSGGGGGGGAAAEAGGAAEEKKEEKKDEPEEESDEVSMIIDSVAVMYCTARCCACMSLQSLLYQILLTVTSVIFSFPWALAPICASVSALTDSSIPPALVKELG